MLIPRSDRTPSGQKLTVSVTYPRRYVLARLVRGLTWKGALLGGILGFAHAAYTHSSGQNPTQGNAAMIELAVETVAGTVLGGAAGLTGALAYAFIGGAPGAAAGILGAGLVVGGSYAALPSIAALPQSAEKAGETVKVETSRKLGYIEPGQTDNPYTPVISDDTIKEEAPPAAPIYNGPYNDRIVFLGMNAGPTARATARMKRRAEVTVISNTGPQDRVRVGGKLHDLRDKAGIAAFAKGLGLPAPNAAGVRRALQMCEKDAKDELAQLALVWARGEKGAKIPSRLVLAGHSNGDGVVGRWQRLAAFGATARTLARPAARDRANRGRVCDRLLFGRRSDDGSVSLDLPARQNHLGLRSAGARRGQRRHPRSGRLGRGDAWAQVEP